MRRATSFLWVLLIMWPLSVGTSSARTFQEALGTEGVYRVLKEEIDRVKGLSAETLGVRIDVDPSFLGFLQEQVLTVEVDGNREVVERSLRASFGVFLSNFMTFLIAPDAYSTGPTKEIRFTAETGVAYLAEAAKLGRCGEIPCNRNCKPCDNKCNKC